MVLVRRKDEEARWTYRTYCLLYAQATYLYPSGILQIGMYAYNSDVDQYTVYRGRRPQRKILTGLKMEN